MGFSTNDGMVRVDRFKPGGKWYDTWAVDMSRWYNQDCGRSSGELLPPTWEAVRLAILANFQERNPDKPFDAADRFFRNWTWVCLEPYHAQAYPIMFVSTVTVEDAVYAPLTP